MKRVAAFDCGTNSLRLLIADVDAAARWSADVVRHTEIVRLGQGVDGTGMFAVDALERTFRVLDRYVEEVEVAGVEATRFVATSAARDVANRDAFVTGVRGRLGIEPDVISGDEEARLSYDGATRTLDGREFDRPYLVVDIGGGSTELVTRIGDSGPIRGQSVDIGSVRLTERHLADDPPTAEQVAGAEADIAAALDELTFGLDDAGTMVGVAGSVTTMVAMALDLPAYDRDRIHHAWIGTPDLDAAVERMVSMRVEERRALPYMAPGRADVIGGGALVLRAVLRRSRLDGMIASEHDILDGIAWSLA
jgi:exopolyphosphatase / guanosine-5'-triphosphate,3'-diphosphate pyrophosphatase